MHPSEKNATLSTLTGDQLAAVAMANYRRLLRDYAALDAAQGPYVMSPAHMRERHLGVLQGLLAAAAGKHPSDALVNTMIEEQARTLRKAFHDPGAS
jgi:hypothetical protein